MSRSFAEPFVQAQIKENNKGPCHCHLWGESTGDRGNVSIWWRHHDQLGSWWYSGFPSLEILPVILIWWRHQMKTFSALLTLCAGNSPVPGEFPAQRPVTRSFDIFFDLRPTNKRLSKQSWGWWFETLSCPLWRHYNELHKDMCSYGIANDFSDMGYVSRINMQLHITVHHWAKVLVLFCTCQFFKLIFWDRYKNLAICNMNLLSNLSFFCVCVNPLRFSGH